MVLNRRKPYIYLLLFNQDHTPQEKWSTIQKETYAIHASFKKMVFYLRDAHILIKSDHAPLQKFIHSNTTNDRLTAWAQDLFAITPHIDFKHMKGSQNILSDAIMRVKRFSLYNKIIPIPESQSDSLLLISPSQESLEIPIFDRYITWQVHNVVKETTNGFMLNNTWCEIDKTSSEKYLPLNDLMTTKAPMVQLKLSTEGLRKLQAADKQNPRLWISCFKAKNILLSCWMIETYCTEKFRMTINISKQS